MAETSLRFVPLGYGYVVCVNNIVAIIPQKTVQGRRHIRDAKKEGRFYDWCAHRKLHSVIILDNNTVIGCAYSTKSVFDRIRKVIFADPLMQVATPGIITEKTAEKMNAESQQAAKDIAFDDEKYGDDGTEVHDEEFSYEEDDAEIRQYSDDE